jgi:hypothetical protein
MVDSKRFPLKFAAKFKRFSEFRVKNFRQSQGLNKILVIRTGTNEFMVVFDFVTPRD